MTSNTFLTLAILLMAPAAFASTKCSYNDVVVTADVYNGQCNLVVETPQQTQTQTLMGPCDLQCGNKSALVVQDAPTKTKLTLIVDNLIGTTQSVQGEFVLALPTAFGLTYSGTETHWIPLDTSGVNQSGTETHWVVPPGAEDEESWLIGTKTQFATLWAAGVGQLLPLNGTMPNLDESSLVKIAFHFDWSLVEVECDGACVQ